MFRELSCCLAVLSFTACDTKREADQQAWEALVEISRSNASQGSQANDTHVSWRLWWTQPEIYPPQYHNDTSHTGPQTTGMANLFRPLTCLPETERNKANLPGKASLSAQQCEAVWLNEAAAQYIFDKKLWNRRSLIDAAMNQGVHFPADRGNVSRQLKTEWRPLTDPSTFSRYVVAVDANGSTYGLVAFHLMSHELPEWLWATWLHEDFKDQMPPAIGFHDSFGATSDQMPSRELKALLAAHHEEFLLHYKLIGFTDPSTLGNPLIEGASEEALRKVSCIGCHRKAAIDEYGSWSIKPPFAGQIPIPPGRFSADFDFTAVLDSVCPLGDAKCTQAFQFSPSEILRAAIR